MRLVSSRPSAPLRLAFTAPVSIISSPGSSRHWHVPSDAERERLFEALDGQLIAVNGGTWRVRVYGISEEPGAWWLQLSLDGTPDYTITMRAPSFQTACDISSRLSRWLADPTNGAHTDGRLTLAADATGLDPERSAPEIPSDSRA